MDGPLARERILSAMVELVAAHGFADLTIERVAGHAEVSEAEFEREFRDLEACLLAVLDETARHAARLVQRAAADAARGLPTSDPAQRLEVVFEPSLAALLRCAAGQPELTRVCVVDVATIGTRGLAKRDAVLERFVQLLEQTLPDLPERPSQLASEMVVGGVHELLQRRARIGDMAELPNLAPALAAVWLPVLRGQH
jgi:AcrR family transcriptional regulator